MKALGKKPPVMCGCMCNVEGCNGNVEENAEHYRRSMIEAANELEKHFGKCDGLDLDCVACWATRLANDMRISAGVKK